MPDRYLKTGDTYPPLEATLTDQDGIIDLTTADSVRVIMKSGTTVIEGLCVVADAIGGVVEYEWAAGDTDIAGDYETEFEITWDVGLIETVPNVKSANPTVHIQEDLD